MKLSLTKLGAMVLLLGVNTAVWAHGDVLPQAVDVSSLPPAKNEARNPYVQDPKVFAEAVRVGASAYAQNCARCHGIDAVSGGIAPDLRYLEADCHSMASDSAKNACLAEIEEYFANTVLQGRTRDGRVYMPPFKEVFGMEAIWAINAYVKSVQTERQ